MVDWRRVAAAAAATVLISMAAVGTLMATKPTVLEQFVYQTQVDPSNQVFSYSTSVAPEKGNFVYSTTMEPSQQVHTYSTQMTSQPSTFTYSTTYQEQPSSFTYSTMVQPEQTQFTYTGTPTGQGAGFNTYIAQQVDPKTIVNGYVQPQASNEEWYTVPIGSLHPLDVAGTPGLGNVESVNPDGTARAMAPLTLSGERADGTVSTEDARGRRMGLKEQRGREEQLLQVPDKSREMERIFRTPVDQVASLTAKERTMWAKHVIAEVKRAKWLKNIATLSIAQVKKLSPADQKLWAKATLKQANLQWANSASHLVHKELSSKKGPAAAHQGPGVMSGQRVKSREGQKGVVTSRPDMFGMPDLSGPWSSKSNKLPSSLAEINSSLRTDTPCGVECMRRAEEAARSMLPTS
ncbi:hypothetical protein GUITHDRAFT_166558 [Guillardia theta CCMP2712]|uniref:Uncharacterized protein n=1 Tax=Guillardia theta (strain CCMP2712) TaxID=905079 RepID=L1IAZ5_GUITC|nr:hypothetical protein GUITHDRAFT_166558 [Guillardia theta CCMP2712]EKX33089.1 hypothetical protein GUITHDRAFT_166558 [Guillardia theta CCMP2712]|eukprot:XP_005820069.1 hypothetical protein GUITHDRAFT_166558 [Guillardia theta CCMP2712]